MKLCVHVVFRSENHRTWGVLLGSHSHQLDTAMRENVYVCT